MKPRSNLILLAGVIMMSLGAVSGLICAFIVGETNPVVGWVMGTITLTPVLFVLILWLYVLEQRGKRKK